MSLTGIAPWLQLPNFMAAAEAGARIGLSQHQLAQEKALKEQELAQQANEAAGRLGLGLSQLPIEIQKNQLQHEANQAALALRGRRYDDLNEIADRRANQSDARLTALENNRDTVNDLRRRGLDTAEDRLTALENNRDTVNDLRTRALDLSQQRVDKPGKTGRGNMVSVPIPALPGQAGSGRISLPEDDPRAQKYLRSVGMNVEPPAAPDLDAANAAGVPAMESPDAASALRFNPLSTPFGATGNTSTPPGALPSPVATPVSAKPITPEIAARYLQAVGGDKQKARDAARADGYAF